MIRHASAEDLAGLDLGALKPRKAARVRNHIAGCIKCTQLSGRVSAVRMVLASVTYPPMPESFVTRLDTTIASESARRIANAPATEAGRRDLPERRSRSRWQLPGVSAVGTRLVAAAAALVIIGFGGYEIATHVVGKATTTAASNGSAAVPSAGAMTLGPTVQYGTAHAAKTVRTVSSSTNFTTADLGAQALAAVQSAKAEGATGATGATHVAAPAPTSGGASANSSVRSHTASPASLAGCLDRIVGSQPVQLVETAKFDGQPATIIVTTPSSAGPAEVWVVGAACSATNSDVLAHETLSRT